MHKAGPSFTRLFVMFAVLPLLFIAGVQLFILSEQTDTYFAWTISVPLTAAFLGAGFWAALVASFAALRQPATVWVRVTGPASIAATGLLGVATLLHLDKFHLASPALLTRFVTWVWIAVYVVTPFLFLVLWMRQGRAADDSAGHDPLPQWVRACYSYEGGLAVVMALAFFLAPTQLGPMFWPWPLTALTARAIAAWLAAYGLACLMVDRENDLANTWGTRASLFAFCLLQLVAVVRYLSIMEWTRAVAWLYVLVLVVGAVAFLPSLRPRSA